MDYAEEQAGEIEALLSIYEGDIEGKREIELVYIHRQIRHLVKIFK